MKISLTKLANIFINISKLKLIDKYCQVHNYISNSTSNIVLGMDLLIYWFIDLLICWFIDLLIC